MFLGIILRVLRLEVSIYNVYITNQFQTPFAQGGVNVGVKSVSRGDCAVNSKEENSSYFCPNYFHEFGLGLGQVRPCALQIREGLNQLCTTWVA
jgi:hypothetical protein